VYNTSDRVWYQGAIYEASWRTQNQVPGATPWSSWQQIAETEAGVAIWTPSRIFNAGDVVTYQGHTYKAKWWTRNQAPGDPRGPWQLND